MPAVAERRAPRPSGVAAPAVLLAATLAVALVAVACGGGSGSSGNLTTGTTVAGVGGAGAERSEPVTTRLALTPDPIWQWLEDTGAVAEWERSRNIRIEASQLFDQFAAFAGGHADVVLINALDVPKFVEQPNREPVIIGKYARDRSILAVRRTSRAETLGDLVERRIAVESSLASTLLWGLIADSLYDLDLRDGSADFELITVEPTSVADLVIRGDADACICTPDFSVPFLASGRLRPLYGGDSAAEVYARDVLGDPARLPIADAFVADREWHSQHPDAVDALLALWEKGLEDWKLAKADFVAEYPHHFSVESDDEVAWMSDYVANHDWIVGSVYISEAEAEAHSATFARMQRLELVPAGSTEPEIDLSYSQELSALREILEPDSGGEGSEGDLDRLSTRLSVPDEEPGG